MNRRELIATLLYNTSALITSEYGNVFNICALRREDARRIVFNAAQMGFTTKEMYVRDCLLPDR